MADSTQKVCWNGIQVDVPASWETIVSGHRHLLFEDDFTPQFQFRWEKAGPLKEKDIERRASHLWDKTATIRTGTTVIPPGGDSFNDLKNFSFFKMYYNPDGSPAGGICYCNSCTTIVIFQLLTTDRKPQQIIEKVLQSIVCHGMEQTSWCLQDFSLILPGTLTLENYTFRAGLTRLGFTGPDYTLQACKLAPADHHLREHSLTEILLSLTGTDNLKINVDMTSCEGHRKPTIGQQLLYRLKRQSPFISSRIWYETQRNKLLAIVIFSKAVIEEGILMEHCSNYGII